MGLKCLHHTCTWALSIDRKLIFYSSERVSQEECQNWSYLGHYGWENMQHLLALLMLIFHLKLSLVCTLQCIINGHWVIRNALSSIFTLNQSILFVVYLFNLHTDLMDFLYFLIYLHSSLHYFSHYYKFLDGWENIIIILLHTFWHSMR